MFVYHLFLRASESSSIMFGFPHRYISSSCPACMCFADTRPCILPLAFSWDTYVWTERFGICFSSSRKNRSSCERTQKWSSFSQSHAARIIAYSGDIPVHVATKIFFFMVFCSTKSPNGPRISISSHTTRFCMFALPRPPSFSLIRKWICPSMYFATE